MVVGLFFVTILGGLYVGVCDYIRFLVWKRKHDKTNDGEK